MAEAHTQTPQTPWTALVFMVFILLLMGGVVALSYSPLIDHLFRIVDPQPPQPAAPVTDQSKGVPAPDNAITESAPSSPTFPAPNNTKINSPLTPERRP